MKLVCFGSLNIDYVYDVDTFVKAEETIHSRGFSKKCGGKGLNQAVALAKAGTKTYMAGAVSASGAMLTEYCQKCGVDATYIDEKSAAETGHAIIQVDSHGQNCILLYGGANQHIETAHIDTVLDNFGVGDYIILQNEINNIDYIIHKAKRKGMVIVFNPSPIDESIKKYPLELVDIFVMNRIEGMILSGCENSEPETMVKAIAKKFPQSQILLTLGKRGAIYSFNEVFCFQEIYDSPVVDTTGAGDTFAGYFISRLILGDSVQTSMKIATKAAAIAVSKKGAVESIPSLAEVQSAVFM